MPTPDFSHRSQEMEIMDDLHCQGEVVDQTLRELEFINRWLGGNAVTLEGIRQLLGTGIQDSITIADLGCGGGDMLKMLALWGRKNHLPLRLIGFDANPHIVAFARKNCAGFEEISFQTEDIFSKEFSSRRFDIISGTLFCHHFDNGQLKELFSGLLKQARLGLVINDIHRHWLAYYSIRVLTAIFSKSAMVKFDAPLSVLRAFQKKELEKILSESGATAFSLKWKWAFRWQVVVPCRSAG